MIGQARCGLLIESEDGERHYVDTSDITDAVGEAGPRRMQRMILARQWTSKVR